MENQQNNFEDNKDRMRISGDGFYSAPIQNYPTRIKFTSILLSVAFTYPLSILYCLSLTLHFRVMLGDFSY